MCQETLNRLRQSSFRARFHLSAQDKIYIRQKGMDTVRRHAADFIARRVAPADIKNDGRQTPMRGHPVFVAQHAVAACCRGCIFKWHHFPKEGALSATQQAYLTDLIMAWIAEQMKNAPHTPGEPTLFP